MQTFEMIYAMAARRMGGSDSLQKHLTEAPAKTLAAIAAIPDDRVLAIMTRRVFYAGFSPKVVDTKWSAFESAFRSFDPRACAALTVQGFARLMKESDIIHNAAKIKSVQANASLVLALASDRGGAAAFLAEWPDADYVGLLEVLKVRGSRLGGDTGMRFLRDIGKPSFLVTAAVVAALVREGILARPPKSKRDLAAVQTAFNAWAHESGRDLTEISRVLGASVEGDARAE